MKLVSDSVSPDSKQKKIIDNAIEKQKEVVEKANEAKKKERMKDPLANLNKQQKNMAVQQIARQQRTPQE